MDMKKDLAGGGIGKGGHWDIKVEAGVVKLSIMAGADVAAGVKVGGSAFAEVSPEAFAQAIKNAIPGKVDDFVIDALLKMLKGVE